MKLNQDSLSSTVKFVDLNSNPNVFTQPLTVKQGSSTLHYKPKAILSRYVVGQPVAFTDQPNLPVHYQHLSPSKVNFNQFPIIETISNHIPFQNQNTANLSKSLYKNAQSDFVLQSRKRTISYDNKISQSPGKSNYQPQISMSYVRKQAFEKILQQNTELRNQNSRLVQQNRKLKQYSYPDSNNNTPISQLYRKITQLTHQIQTLKSSNKLTTTTDISATVQTSNNVFSQLKQEQIEEIFTSCLQKYRVSILEQQKLLVDRYRLECKNDELNLKKNKLQESRRQEEGRGKTYSCYQQGGERMFTASMKENWENVLPMTTQGHYRHWRKTKN